MVVRARQNIWFLENSRAFSKFYMGFCFTLLVISKNKKRSS